MMLAAMPLMLSPRDTPPLAIVCHALRLSDFLFRRLAFFRLRHADFDARAIA